MNGWLRTGMIVVYTLSVPPILLFVWWFWDRDVSLVADSFTYVELEWVAETESLRLAVIYLVDRDCDQMVLQQISGPNFIRQLEPSPRYTSTVGAINTSTGFEDLVRIPGLDPGEYNLTVIMREWCNPLHDYFNIPIESVWAPRHPATFVVP